MLKVPTLVRYHFLPAFKKGTWCRGGCRRGHRFTGGRRRGAAAQDRPLPRPEKLRSMMQGMVRELVSMDAVCPVEDGQILEPVIP